MSEVSVLFVCMGNICRSPTAEGVMRQLLRSEGLEERVRLDSAGTHAYHVNEPPDLRAQEAALRRGIDLSDLRARAVEIADFKRFDHIIAMDHANLEILERITPAEGSAMLSLMLSWCGVGGEVDGVAEVPDPYYGGADGFEQVLDLLEEASRGLLRSLRR